MSKPVAYVVVLATVAAALFWALAVAFDTKSAVLGVVVFLAGVACREAWVAFRRGAETARRIFQEELDDDPFRGQHGNQRPDDTEPGETR